ncbi:MAG TPA: tripartite tricarboxylate transporter TctB family protein [Thermodesulfobacteriota bacterium]|nr:tripartite tricarboxylate transporter TctB family protein [Thermodesulfobacteriota bacterium]
MKKDEAIVGIVIFLFGLLTTALSLGMPIGTFRMAGTGMFPLFLGILLMILSGVFVLRVFLQGKEKQARKEASIESSESPMQLILFLGTMVLATLFFSRLGYPLTSFLLVLGLLRTLGIKRWGLNILISLVTAAGSYFLFVKWLDIPMPKGWIGI